MTLTLRSTGYNSLRSQTDHTPHITATGARTRFGIVALSRDLLRSIPYGSRITIRDLGSWSGGRGAGKYNTMLRGMIFVVEDTMHPRKSGTLDVWFPARRQAIQWGVRRIQITVIQRGR
jgi:3D (Asp-Asp-Asp) domain-containing protein